MRSVLIALWLGLAGLAQAAPEGTAERIAVLELSGKVDQDLIGMLSDDVRAGVLDGTKGSGLIVMSRENIAVMAEDMGLDLSCIEGTCEVETARNLGAKYVVSGTVVESASRWDCTVKIHETTAGALLQSDRVSGPDSSALLDKLRPMVRRLASAAIQVRSTAVQVGPVTETGQAEVLTGASADFAALAARAAQAKANREHKEKALAAEQARLEAQRLAQQKVLAAERARLAEEERRTTTALRAAQQARMETAAAELRAQATADFAEIEPLVQMQVTAETRPVLQAYLDKWSGAKVKVDDLERKVSVPELVAVRRAMSSSAARAAKAAPVREPVPQPSRPTARSRGALVATGALSVVGGSMLAWSAIERSNIKSNLQSGEEGLSSAESRASTVNIVVIAGYSALGAGAAVWVGMGMRNTAAGPSLGLGGRW